MDANNKLKDYFLKSTLDFVSRTVCLLEYFRLRKNKYNNQMNVITMQNALLPPQTRVSLYSFSYLVTHYIDQASAVTKGMFPMPDTKWHLNSLELNSKSHIC